MLLHLSQLRNQHLSRCPTPEPTPEPVPTPEPTPEPVPTPEPTPEPVPTPEPMPPVDAGDTLGPQPIPEPFVPTVSEDPLDGQSRLGGLSLNTTSGKRFVDKIIASLALPVEAGTLVDSILALVPKGFLPKKQIRQILTSNHQAIAFANEAKQLDPENFGNAITPNFADYASLVQGGKYLTRDSLQVYTRVPSASVGGVTFNLSGGRTIEGTQVTPGEFQADTISYTFRLEETLAATNLPAWPSLDTQLFSGVDLRYSQTGLTEDYIRVPMQPMVGENGVVWETEIGIPPGVSTYYYFEVTLVEPVELTTFSREKLAEISQSPHTVSLEGILSATTVLRIESWAMPDPRNLQLADRGIIDAIFTADVRAEMIGILGSSQAAPIISKFLSGQQVTLTDVLGIITPKQQRRLQNLLLRNTNKLMENFEASFDPMLASVFTVPRINPETESIWVASIDGIADGNYELMAQVYRDDGMVADEIIEGFTVDTSAPEADIKIDEMNPGTNVTGYWNSENIFVATAPNPGAAVLNVMGDPKRTYTGQGVGPGEGYLFYQEVQLDAHGIPTSTWMPLTIESTMLTSRIWTAVLQRNGDQIVSFLKQNFPQLVGGLDAASILSLAMTTSPEAILALIAPGTIQMSANSVFKSLGINNFTLTDAQAETIHQALGASIDIVDHLVPVTFDVPNIVMMPIQGAHMPLMIGEYGVRAMGIDTLFNVGAYAEPTRLRVVMPEADKASVTAASIGDRNGDGDADEPYESGTIYANTTDGVMLTLAVMRTAHPASIWAEYMDANGKLATHR